MADGSFVVSAMRCGSWSCPDCRKINASRLLERVHDGMSTRSDWQTFLVTLTVDPSHFGATPRSFHGYQYGKIMPLESSGDKLDIWDTDLMPDAAIAAAGIRFSPHYHAPTLEQYQDVAAHMSLEFSRLRRRLTMRAKRLKLENVEYLRVAELHRNGWIHYHAVFQLPPGMAAHHLHESVSSWWLGRTDVREVNAADAVSHVVPYLTSEETHRNKGYQFAADALPKHFRLWTASKNFLGQSPDLVEVAKQAAVDNDLPPEVAEAYVASMTPIQVVRDGRHVTKLLDDFRSHYDAAASVTWALHNDAQNPSRFTLNNEQAPLWFATLPYFEKLDSESRLAYGASVLPEAETVDALTGFWLKSSNERFFDNVPSRDWSSALSPPERKPNATQSRLYFIGGG